MDIIHIDSKKCALSIHFVPILCLIEKGRCPPLLFPFARTENWYSGQKVTCSEIILSVGWSVVLVKTKLRVRQCTLQVRYFVSSCSYNNSMIWILLSKPCKEEKWKPQMAEVRTMRGSKVSFGHQTALGFLYVPLLLICGPYTSQCPLPVILWDNLGIQPSFWKLLSPVA